MFAFLSSTGALVAVLAAGSLGLLGLFRNDDDPDLERLARHLDAEPDAAVLERRIEQLTESIDRLVADADLQNLPGHTPAPDAPSVEKAQALASAVERNHITFRPPTVSGGDAGPVVRAARQLERERSPSSEAGQRLLRELATSSATAEADLREVLQTVTETLDAAESVSESVADANDPDRLRRDLEGMEHDLAEGVRMLAAELAEASNRADRAADSRDDLERSAEAILDSFDTAADPTDTLAVRLRSLANDVEREGAPAGTRQAVARRVRREQNPRSTTARDLLDGIAADEGRDLERALADAVTELDAAATNRSVLESMDPASVATLGADVADRVSDLDAPLADALADRVEDLRETLDRADESNRVIVYAVRHELRYYDGTLVPRLQDEFGRAEGETAVVDGDVADRLADVSEQREAIESAYVDGRSDHNHTIPLHFLSLVDTLRDEAEQYRTEGQRARANGVLDAAEETLEHVEALYERNAYSVLLRRLRG